MAPDTPTYIGPIVAACIAGAIAFLASVLSKELKTSEFRQTWIDALRNDLADLNSLVLLTDDMVAYKVREGNQHEVASYIAENQDLFIKIMASAMRIEMRLNPTEHQALLEVVRQIGTSTKTFRENSDATAAAGERLLVESQKVLKKEWQPVKRGENVFHYTKWLSFWLVAVSVGALAVSIAIWASRVAQSAA